MLDLILTGEIVKVTNDSLSKMLKIHDITCRKNATKSAKIKALMASPSVKEAIPEVKMAEILALLQSMDDKRRKKKTEDDGDDEDKEQGEGEEDRHCCRGSYNAESLPPLAMPKQEMMPDESDEVMMAAAAVVREMEQAASHDNQDYFSQPCALKHSWSQVCAVLRSLHPCPDHIGCKQLTKPNGLMCLFGSWLWLLHIPNHKKNQTHGAHPFVPPPI